MIGSRPLALLAAVLAVLLAGCGESKTATAKGPEGFFGIAAQDEMTEPDIARMGDAKVGSYHLLLSWPRVEPTKGTFNWSSYDELMTQLALQGIKPLPYVFGTPSYYGFKAAVPPVRSKKALKGWAAFLRAAASRYGPDGYFWDDFALEHPGVTPQPLETWEIWNEQNSRTFWSPRPDVGEYAKLLTKSADALRSVDPDAEVMTGGMFGTPIAKTSMDSFDFLRGLFKQKGIKSSFDVVGVHPYAPTVANVKRQMKKTYAVMKDGGVGTKETWVTEIGWGSDPTIDTGLAKTPREQARLLGEGFDMLLANRTRWNIEGVIWYTWHDDTTGDPLCSWCAAAGLFDEDRDPKPALDVFTEYTGGN
jgi:hypothetical protein